MFRKKYNSHFLWVRPHSTEAKISEFPCRVGTTKPGGQTPTRYAPDTDVTTKLTNQWSSTQRGLESKFRKTETRNIFRAETSNGWKRTNEGREWQIRRCYWMLQYVSGFEPITVQISWAKNYNQELNNALSKKRQFCMIKTFHIFIKSFRKSKILILILILNFFFCSMPKCCLIPPIGERSKTCVQHHLANGLVIGQLLQGIQLKSTFILRFCKKKKKKITRFYLP